MISVPFELEQTEFGMLIPGVPLPEKSPKEYSLRRMTHILAYRSLGCPVCWKCSILF